MKRLLYLLCCVFAALLVGCESKEPPTSNKIETGTSENITQSSATVKGVVNVDISAYNSIRFGVMYSTDLDEVNNRSAEMLPSDVLMGKDFSIQLADLTENTKYYYCAYLLLNGMQYEFGAVKEFVTLASNDTPDVPENPDTPDMPENPDTPDMPENPDTPEQPEDPSTPDSGSFVAKPFSVSTFKTVTFSPGNLQYHAVNNEWRFAPMQTDYIGEDNANISSTYNGWIDLFGWGTGNNPTNASTDYNNDYQTFVDWGVNKIGNDAPNTWRTLTYDEWYYLRYERPNYDKLIGVAQVNGVNGLILLPDGWTCPSGVTFKSGFADNYGDEYYASYQSFSASEWSKLEASGAVFLPAAGDRYGSFVYGVQDYGYYWSATEYNSNRAYYLYFYSDGAYMGHRNRYGGLSVRLVQD